MTPFEIIIAIVNTPLLIGVLVWIIKVETRLAKIETTCIMRNRVCDAEVN